MRTNFNNILVVAILAFAGCNTQAPTAYVENNTTDKSSATTTSASPVASDDPAQYSFHRGVPLTAVTKDMPAGSVDHIDFDMAADPSVVVVVTVTAKHKDGLHFTTTFTGTNDLTITKEWQPASGAEPKDKYVGLFVLPGSVSAGSTVVH